MSYNGYFLSYSVLYILDNFRLIYFFDFSNLLFPVSVCSFSIALLSIFPYLLFIYFPLLFPLLDLHPLQGGVLSVIVTSAVLPSIYLCCFWLYQWWGFSWVLRAYFFIILCLPLIFYGRFRCEIWWLLWHISDDQLSTGYHKVNLIFVSYSCTLSIVFFFK